MLIGKNLSGQIARLLAAVPTMMRGCLFVFVLFFAQGGQAAQTFNSVTVDGGASVTVLPSANITVVIGLTTSGGTRWRSTSWQIGAGAVTCVNHANHDSNGAYSETFSIAAPVAEATYSLNLVASSDNSCGSTTTAYSLSNSIVVSQPPTVLSINRVGATPSNAASVSWTVTFSESVTGVDAADFSLVQAGGVSGASITSVTGSGATWTVLVSTGSGQGTLGLNLVDNDTILDVTSNKLGGVGAGNGNFTGQVYAIDKTAPSVLSISRANSSPTSATSVAWNVTFDEAVSSVDATDFSLLQGGGLSAAAIMSVSGAGTTWVVTASTGYGTGTLGLNLADDDSIIDAAGNKLGGVGVGNGSFTGEVYSVTPAPCPPPSNLPVGVTVTCQCDNFTRATLNPSTIFGANWVATTSDATGIVPRIVNSGYMRLTENTGNNAKAATVPGIFPAAGNYISVEFNHYAYNGSGADGIAVTLSDYAIPAQPGAFGGSLGYAQRTGVVGFAGGWVGIALDEYGNYQNPTEGRIGGAGFIVQSVGMRGSGSGLTGYYWLAGTANLTTVAPNLGIDNRASAVPAPGYRYQIVVDARNDTSGVTAVAVNRDTTGSGTYSSLISVPNVYTAATSAGFTQAPVPVNWQVSFTGSTGGATNIHELGALKICAQTMVPTTGGVLGGFNAIDESYARGTNNALQGYIFTKLAGTAFKLNVAALNPSSTGIQTTYAISGNKTVTLELIDDSGSATACNSSASACSACANTVVATQTMTFTSGDTGFKQSANFTVNGAYSRLIARIKDGTTTGCSVDAFSVRPTAFSSLTSTATQATLSGTPTFKAGSDSFTMSVTANASNYAGVSATPKINTAAMQANAAGWAVGAFSPVLFPAASASVASGSFTYGEVGNFLFRGYDPATDTTTARGIYDDTWTAVDQGAEVGCVAGSYSNTKNASGKYGCLFGITASSASFGRFVPDHFALVSGTLGEFCAGTTRNFSYMGQAQLSIAYQLEARNGGNVKTSNYSAALTPAYPVTAPTLVAEDQTAANQGCDLASRITGLPATTWAAGTYTVPTTSTSFSRPVTPVTLDATSAATCLATRANAGGPFWALDVGVQMIDADGAVITQAPTVPALDMNAATVGTCSGVGCTARRIGSTAEVYGRLQLGNAYGSELLAMPVPLEAQFWNPGGFWATNRDDRCTSITPSTIALSGFTQNLSACETQFLPNTAVTLVGGKAPLRFSASGAGNNGTVSLSLNIGAAAVGTTCLATGAATATTAANMPWFGTTNPAGRATFGVYKTPLIYRRENY